MTMTVTVELTAVEQELIRITRTLPSERVAQLVDFARFLAYQTTQRSNGWDEEEATQEGDPRADEERWERLLSRPEAQELMLKMAQEALEEYHATKWEQRIERDLETGRLDTLLAEVDAEYEAGTARPL